ncbi:ATG carboxy-terminal domain protein [Gregarina niphandrodes]|uniref:ATG carboxy-terminal domain protein n=1 Tax=Gregarina niphandrodes TaxID=110365 RepID=A0A023BBP9_GRENI|nr:ATG carboxy-terminal domain protein [Gregarina niphandrodes]EZG79658.1 ATG carboxy-terminal domain protein [Gregarina niphandrodes]|eukprot:XP_011134403.1 ATG carboxy-terminal domain protein [Gregarina niphandrodes]
MNIHLASPSPDPTINARRRIPGLLRPEAFTPEAFTPEAFTPEALASVCVLEDVVIKSDWSSRTIGVVCESARFADLMEVVQISTSPFADLIRRILAPEHGPGVEHDPYHHEEDLVGQTAANFGNAVVGRSEPDAAPLGGTGAGETEVSNSDSGESSDPEMTAYLKRELSNDTWSVLVQIRTMDAAWRRDPTGNLPSCHLPSCHLPSCHLPSCHLPSCHLPSCHLPSCHQQAANQHTTNLLADEWLRVEDVCIEYNAEKITVKVGWVALESSLLRDRLEGVVRVSMSQFVAHCRVDASAAEEWPASTNENGASSFGTTPGRATPGATPGAVHSPTPRRGGPRVLEIDSGLEIDIELTNSLDQTVFPDFVQEEGHCFPAASNAVSETSFQEEGRQTLYEWINVFKDFRLRMGQNRIQFAEIQELPKSIHQSLQGPLTHKSVANKAGAPPIGRKTSGRQSSGRMISGRQSSGRQSAGRQSAGRQSAGRQTSGGSIWERPLSATGHKVPSRNLKVSFDQLEVAPNQDLNSCGLRLTLSSLGCVWEEADMPVAMVSSLRSAEFSWMPNSFCTGLLDTLEIRLSDTSPAGLSIAAPWSAPCAWRDGLKHCGSEPQLKPENVSTDCDPNDRRRCSWQRNDSQPSCWDAFAGRSVSDLDPCRSSVYLSATKNDGRTGPCVSVKELLVQLRLQEALYMAEAQMEGVSVNIDLVYAAMILEQFDPPVEDSPIQLPDCNLRMKLIDCNIHTSLGSLSPPCPSPPSSSPLFSSPPSPSVISDHTLDRWIYGHESGVITLECRNQRMVTTSAIVQGMRVSGIDSYDLLIGTDNLNNNLVGNRKTSAPGGEPVRGSINVFTLRSDGSVHLGDVRLDVEEQDALKAMGTLFHTAYALVPPRWRQWLENDNKQTKYSGNDQLSRLEFGRPDLGRLDSGRPDSGLPDSGHLGPGEARSMVFTWVEGMHDTTNKTLNPEDFTLEETVPAAKFLEIDSLSVTVLPLLQLELDKVGVAHTCVTAQKLRIKDLNPRSRYENIIQSYNKNAGRMDDDDKAAICIQFDAKPIDNSLEPIPDLIDLTVGTLQTGSIIADGSVEEHHRKTLYEYSIRVQLSRYLCTLDFGTLVLFFESFPQRNTPPSTACPNNASSNGPNNASTNGPISTSIPTAGIPPPRVMCLDKESPLHSLGIHQARPERSDTSLLLIRKFSIARLDLVLEVNPDQDGRVGGRCRNPRCNDPGCKSVQMKALNVAMKFLKNLNLITLQVLPIHIVGLHTPNQLGQKLVKEFSNKKQTKLVLRRLLASIPFANVIEALLTASAPSDEDDYQQLIKIRKFRDIIYNQDFENVLGLDHDDLCLDHDDLNTDHGHDPDVLDELGLDDDNDDIEPGSSPLLESSLRFGQSSTEVDGFDHLLADVSCRSARVLFRQKTTRVSYWLEQYVSTSFRRLVRSKDGILKTSGTLLHLLALQSLHCSSNLITTFDPTSSRILPRELRPLKLGRARSHLRQARSSNDNDPSRDPSNYNLNEGEESPQSWDLVNRGADDFCQPESLAEGLETAVLQLKRGVRDVGSLVDGGSLFSIACVIPTMIVTPLISLTSALESALQGATNSLDPTATELRKLSLKRPQ